MLLLDTNIIIPLVRQRAADLPRDHQTLLSGAGTFRCSAASLWEIAIKSRLGKLPLPVSIAILPVTLEAIGIQILPVLAEYVVEELAVAPATKDPFDRLLLAQCQVEKMQLVTIDRALAAHPLAWTPASA